MCSICSALQPQAQCFTNFHYYHYYYYSHQQEGLYRVLHAVAWCSAQPVLVGGWREMSRPPSILATGREAYPPNSMSTSCSPRGGAVKEHRHLRPQLWLLAHPLSHRRAEGDMATAHRSGWPQWGTTQTLSTMRGSHRWGAEAPLRWCLRYRFIAVAVVIVSLLLLAVAVVLLCSSSSTILLAAFWQLLLFLLMFFFYSLLCSL